MKKNIKKAKPLKLEKSDMIWNSAAQIIPGGCQTFSKAPFQHVNGVSPKIIEYGKGGYSWDADGNEYIDYMMSLGPNILGYADEKIIKAAETGARLGVVSSLAHPLETKLAKSFVKLVPSAEMVKFGKNGSDVTTAAIRLARAYTNKEKIIICGYHGWHDWYIGSTSRNFGIPKASSDLTIEFQYNNIDSLIEVFNNNKNEVAAVIMEPVNFYEPMDNFLSKVKEVCHDNKSLLIFDEIITGFRMDIGGAQSFYNITPDLSCFGKAMANGYPISAIVGKKEIMKLFEDVFFSGTFGGELVSISACIETIQQIEKRNTIEHINNLGNKLKDGYKHIVRQNNYQYFTDMIGFGWWPEYIFYDLKKNRSLEIQSLFQQEIVRRGILTRAGMFFCGSHTEKDIDDTLLIFEEALYIVNQAIKNDKILDYLDGDVITPVIRTQS